MEVETPETPETGFSGTSSGERIGYRVKELPDNDLRVGPEFAAPRRKLLGKVSHLSHLSQHARRPAVSCLGGPEFGTKFLNHRPIPLMMRVSTPSMRVLPVARP